MKQFGLTDVGIVRESNQDVFAVGISGNGIPYAFVCDGMGGPGGGEIASACAHNIIVDFFKSRQSGTNIEDVTQAMRSLIKTINSEILALASQNSALAGMGTTLVAAFLFKTKALVVNIGDSRAYLMSDGDICQITKDHSVVQELIDIGSITKVDAASHPQKNIITRALGAYEDVEADYYTINIKKDAKILLCSDGLSNLVDMREIQLELDINDTIEEAATTLVESAKLHGGTDNISVAILSNED